MKKRLLALLLFGLLAGSSCRPDTQQQQLQQRETALARREQELLARESRVVLLEQRLAQQSAALADDSTRRGATADTSSFEVAGSWSARMNCIETDCPGSAIGDTKSEQWNISNTQGQVLVQATVLGRVVREYSGTLAGRTLSLMAHPTSSGGAPAPDDSTRPDARITVELRVTTAQRLEGRREINRPGNCRIVYALELTKPQPLPLVPAP